MRFTDDRKHHRKCCFNRLLCMGIISASTMESDCAGDLSITEDSFQLQAKGARPDEALEVSLELPILNADLARAQRSAQPEQMGQANSGLLKFNLGDFLPKPMLNAEHPESQETADTEGGGGHFSLRCGQMLVSAEVKSALGVSSQSTVSNILGFQYERS